MHCIAVCVQSLQSALCLLPPGKATHVHASRHGTGMLLWSDNACLPTRRVCISCQAATPELCQCLATWLTRCRLHAGHVVFNGPRENVVEFFESCGFACPERKGVPDFLQEVTSKNDQKVLAHPGETFPSLLPVQPRSGHNLQRSGNGDIP